MAGVKGRSGRKSRVDENTVNSLLLSSHDILTRFFKDPNISLDRKADIASRFVIKSMPSKITGDGTIQSTQIIIVRDSKNEKDKNAVFPEADAGSGHARR